LGFFPVRLVYEGSELVERLVENEIAGQLCCLDESGKSLLFTALAQRTIATFPLTPTHK